MREPPALWSRGLLLVVLYLFLVGAATALLHFAGRGWITALVGGLILAGVLYTFIAVAGRRNR